MEFQYGAFMFPCQPEWRLFSTGSIYYADSPNGTSGLKTSWTRHLSPWLAGPNLWVDASFPNILGEKRPVLRPLDRIGNWYLWHLNMCRNECNLQSLFYFIFSSSYANVSFALWLILRITRIQTHVWNEKYNFMFSIRSMEHISEWINLIPWSNELFHQFHIPQTDSLTNTVDLLILWLTDGLTNL